MNCQFDGCTNPATFHITDRVIYQTMHYCEIHARDHLALFDNSQSSQPTRRNIDFDTFCSACGHDDQSYESTNQSMAVHCPSCSRGILDITGSQHSVITDTDINPTIMRACRIIPVTENDGLLTVASDFVDIELIEKTRFLTNTDFLVVYAAPNHIDSIIETHL